MAEYPGMPPAILYQIKAKHFVAGLERRADIIYKAAPIIRYMEGWGMDQVQNYCRSKHWQLYQVT